MPKEIHTDPLKTIISTNYAIGDLIDYQQIHRGSVNKSYIIKTAARGKIQKYFLRKYKIGKKEDEIKFEHSIITHLKQKQFDLVAGLIRTRDGKTFVIRRNGQNRFLAIFDFLVGEDRYDWYSPECNNDVLGNAAFVLARFHHLASDLKPKHKRFEPRLFDLLPAIAENLTKFAKNTHKTVFTTCLRNNLDAIISTVEQTVDIFIRGIHGRYYSDLVQMVIHCDYHPGNLKFHDSTITGLFDFDWSKIDARCFDVALAIVYFCTGWNEKTGGGLHLGKAACFLQAYQTASTRNSGVGPLSETELKFLPYIIKAANIYVMNWVIQDYVERETEVDLTIYLRYLEHYIQVMHWLNRKGSLDTLVNT